MDGRVVLLAVGILVAQAAPPLAQDALPEYFLAGSGTWNYYGERRVLSLAAFTGGTPLEVPGGHFAGVGAITVPGYVVCLEVHEPPSAFSSSDIVVFGALVYTCPCIPTGFTILDDPQGTVPDRIAAAGTDITPWDSPCWAPLPEQAVPLEAGGFEIIPAGE